MMIVDDLIMIGFGLAVGLWAAGLWAANVWIYRYACGYRDGVKMCTEQLEPVKAELDGMLAGYHTMREEIRLTMQADEPDRETRH